MSKQTVMALIRALLMRMPADLQLSCTMKLNRKARYTYNVADLYVF